MSNIKQSFFWNFFISKGPYILLLVLAMGFVLMGYGLNLYTQELDEYEEKLAETLLAIGEAIVFAGIIGGIISLGFNLYLEEMKKEQEAEEQSDRDRAAMLQKLQTIHDQVELARIYIRSHKSAKTYGEQIRQQIIPAYITLLEIRRGLQAKNEPFLMDGEEEVISFRVSLHYKLAYLSSLIKEYEINYLSISNLQNYQESIVQKMRTDFVEHLQEELDKGLFAKQSESFLERAEELFIEKQIPEPLKVVWGEISQLKYLQDFVNDLRKPYGIISLYNRHFIKHYNYCKSILLPGHTKRPPLLSRKFDTYLTKLKDLDVLKKAQPNSEKIYSLTDLIMEEELGFDLRKEVSVNVDG